MVHAFVGIAASLLLRPEWVSQVARDVDAFNRSLGSDDWDTSRLDRFFTSLPPAECDLERQILSDLRQRLTLEHGLAHDSPAERARRLLNDDYQKPWTLADLTRVVGCNRTTLQEEFQYLTGLTVHRFLVLRRVSVAAQLLEGAAVKVSRVSLEVGYQSHSAFARHFKRITGQTPVSYHESRRHRSAALRD
jgi:AraC-like DNA-binding protein